MDRALFVVVVIALMGSATVGGMLFAFSSFVMRALGRLAPDQGVAAMNAVNTVIIRPSFLLVFMGTAVLSLVATAGAWLRWPRPAALLVLLAALLYTVGTIGLTLVVNQPMNLRLGAMPPAEAISYWPQYLRAWTMWNHVRTGAAMLSALVFLMALLSRR